MEGLERGLVEKFMQELPQAGKRRGGSSTMDEEAYREAPGQVRPVRPTKMDAEQEAEHQGKIAGEGSWSNSKKADSKPDAVTRRRGPKEDPALPITEKTRGPRNDRTREPRNDKLPPKEHQRRSEERHRGARHETHRKTV